MKVIDLLNKIANGGGIMPKRILVDEEEYEFDFLELFYRNIKTGTDLLEDSVEYSTPVFLEIDVIEIKEEQDKIDIQNMKEFQEVRDISDWSNNTLSNNQRLIMQKINELTRAVKQLDKEIKRR